ncbi:MAG: putative oxidoreductase [Bradyrhizobium sp.]|jgi:hypothetical protein|nr:putative oxidoreductase [Bradyrhizobium sp.]
MLTVTKWVDVVTNRVGVPARVLMSLLFLASGVGKISAVAARQAYMQAFGVPGVLLWPAAAWEITAGIFLLIGLAIRPLALLLTGWCLLTAVIFHVEWADQTPSASPQADRHGGRYRCRGCWRLSGLGRPLCGVPTHIVAATGRSIRSQLSHAVLAETVS